jgi:hypothetical protein
MSESAIVNPPNGLMADRDVMTPQTKAGTTREYG